MFTVNGFNCKSSNKIHTCNIKSCSCVTSVSYTVWELYLCLPLFDPIYFQHWNSAKLKMQPLTYKCKHVVPTETCQKPDKYYSGLI